MGLLKKAKKTAKKIKKGVEKVNKVVAEVNSNPFVTAGLGMVGLGGVSTMVAQGTQTVDKTISKYEKYERKAESAVGKFKQAKKGLKGQVRSFTENVSNHPFPVVETIKSILGGF